MPGLRKSLILVLLRRPTLLPAMLGLAWACRPHDWFRRFPFLPLPPAPYLRWRMETAYGEGGSQPPSAEVARFLLWAMRMRRRH
jgi:hypothetical protein